MGKTDVITSSNSNLTHGGDVVVINERKKLLEPENETHTSNHVHRKSQPENIRLEVIHPSSSSRRTSNASSFETSDAVDLHEITHDGDVTKMQTAIDQLDSSIVNEQINIIDYTGRTPLHWAAWFKHLQMCKLLIENGADVNVRDEAGRTAIHLVVEKRSADWGVEENPIIQLLEYLLEMDADVDILDKFGRKPLYYASLRGFVTCAKLLLEASIQRACTGEASAEQLDPSHVIKQLNMKDSIGFTSLHYAAMHKHVKMCKFLVAEGADVNVRDKEGRTALHLVVDKRLIGLTTQKSPSIELLKNLLEDMLEAGAIADVKNKHDQTPLHLACEAGHTQLVRVLLQWKADVTHRSLRRWNALDFAIDSGNPLCAREIIRDEKWREVLRSRSKKYESDDERIDTPMRKLIRKMPEIAKVVFTKCMKDNGKPADDDDYKVTFDNEFLNDEFSCKSWSGINKRAKVYDDNGRVVENAVPYSDDLTLLKKNHPLNIMVEAKQKNLLRHPLVVSLLNHKWRAYGRAVYYLNLWLYLMFMGFFNLYMLTMPPPYSIDSSNMTSSCVAIITEAQQTFGRCYDYKPMSFVAKYFIIVLAAVSLIKELYQVNSKRLSYFQSFTNLFEVLLYILAILTVYSDTNSAGPNYYGVREDWQWQIGAVGIFLSWMVLILFVENAPQFGIYVLMFTEILQTFLKFFIVFVLFILGFAFSFHCLLQNQYGFRVWWNAVITTSLMMIGEFQFEDIFLSEAEALETGADKHTITVSTVNYRAVSYVFFIFFIVIMSIIIMNLLVGLAVDDIKGVRNNAELESLASKVKLTLDVQYTLPLFIRRRVVRKYRKFSPNKYRKRSTFIQWWHAVDNLNTSTISEALNPEKNERDKLEKQVKSLEGKVESMKEEIASLDGKVDSLDGKVEFLERVVVSVDVKAESLERKVESLDGKVGSLNSKFASLDTKVDSLDAKVGSLAWKFGSLDGKVESLQEKMVTLDNRSRSMESMMSALVSHFNVDVVENVNDDESNP